MSSIASDFTHNDIQALIRNKAKTRNILSSKIFYNFIAYGPELSATQFQISANNLRNNAGIHNIIRLFEPHHIRVPKIELENRRKFRLQFI